MRKTTGLQRSILLVCLIALALVPGLAGCRNRGPATITTVTPCGQVSITPPARQIGPGDPEVACCLTGFNEVVRSVLLLNDGSGWTERPMIRNPESPTRTCWRAAIPNPGRGVQVDYCIRLRAGETVCMVPADAPQSTFKISFRGEVSRPVLIAHVIFMLGGMIPLLAAAILAVAGIRTGRYYVGVRRLALIGVASLLVGALPLGIVVERQVFGTYWEGWPLGRDVTDTKTALLLVLWIVLLVVRGKDLFRSTPARRAPRDRVWSAWVIVITVLTLALYLIPHENLKL